MPRGKKDIAAEVLEEIIKAPSIAPTRIFARTSVSYNFKKIMVDSGLIRMERIGKKHLKVSVTEKGREFLTHYRLCNKLFPY